MCGWVCNPNFGPLPRMLITSLTTRQLRVVSAREIFSASLPIEEAGLPFLIKQIHFVAVSGHPIGSDRYYELLASAVKPIRFQNTYKGRMSELSDPSITSAPATAIYAGHTSWAALAAHGPNARFHRQQSDWTKASEPGRNFSCGSWLC